MKKSKLQFSTPILKSSYISINDTFIANNKPDSLNDIEMTIDHEVGYSERDGNSVFVQLRVTVGEESDKYPFVACIEMLAQFTWDKTLKENTIDKLLKINAPAHLLSYARPIISLLTSMTPFPAYNIPFMNLIETAEEDKKEISV